MPGIAVNVAVIEEGKILLTKREDSEAWILPSGGVEEGESLAQAVLQEFKLPALPDKITWKELLELRDQSGLSRQEFYLQAIEKAELKETLEVGMSNL